MSIHALFGRWAPTALMRSGRCWRRRGSGGRPRLEGAGMPVERRTGAGPFLTACVCVALMSCSAQDSVFSKAPKYSAGSEQDLSSVVECIADRWERSTRHLHRSRVGSTVRLQGRTFFRGVPIGVKAWHAAGRTEVQFFEGRAADRIYLLSIRDCLR